MRRVLSFRGGAPLIAVVMGWTGPAFAAPQANPPTGDFAFRQGEWTLKVSSTGDIVDLSDRSGRSLVQAASGDNRIVILTGPAATQPESSRGAGAVCRAPVDFEQEPDGVVFKYDLAPAIPLRVRYEIQFTTISRSAILKRSVTLRPRPPVTTDVLVVVGNNIAPPDGERRIFTPRYNGIGEELGNADGRQWRWTLNGEAGLMPGPVEQLSIPLISDADEGGTLRITHIADPFFSTGFRVADGTARRNGEFRCVYPASKVSMSEPEERTFWSVIQTGGAEKAMDAWYATALADVPPGPDWLHDVALQDYDYMSHGGKGWFEDIDATEKLVAKEERSKVVFALHGWYDLLGRYTFNEKTGKLDDEWTAFPNAPAMKDRFPTSESVKMSKTEMHRRIRYAKDRGFRVCIYFADGMAACDALKDIYTPDQVLRWGGWVGPDTMGKTYVQNPAHPRVYARYVSYLKALLGEYGGEIDALVWDETFHVRMGTIATGEKPAYAARAMMRLVRECTQITTKMQPNCAFMSSDCAGVSFDGKTFWLDVPPYAIMSHGCYQDSHCEPLTWPYGIFPNYRNVLWSCNWSPITHFDYTAYGVEHYRVPVAASNGWLDDKGIARLTPAERDAVMALFNKRKTQRQELHWLTGPPPAFKK